MTRGCLVLLLLVACDPLHTVNATAQLPVAAMGRPAMLVELDGGGWDGVHLPTGMRQLMIAKLVDSATLSGTMSGLGCPQVFVAAWVDLTGQSGLDQQLAGRTLDAQSKYAEQEQVVTLEPASGDLLGVVAPARSSACPPPAYDVTIAGFSTVR